MRIIWPCEVCRFSVILHYKREIDNQMIKLIINFPFVIYKMTEKRQTSQGYIIRILQHFATKLWNVTNFVMLFQERCDEFLSRLV
jgi:hypothetical protein